MSIDLSQVEKLIKLIKGTDITEIEIGQEDNFIRVSRGNQTQQPVATVSHAPIATTETTKPATPAAATPQGHTVRSPMVGTFYAAASPTAKPFVTVGQRVKAGEVLCIVEAMKMLNQIESDKDGVVAARLVENGMPVEFDQPLFVIE